MKFDIQELDPVSREITFEIPATHVDKVLNENYKKLSTQVRLKGYRPGKINRRVLSQFPRYRKIAEGETIKELQEEALNKVIEESDLYIVALPSTDDGKLKAKQDYKFSFTVEVLPKLQLDNLEEIEVVREKIEITDEDIDKAIEEERQKLETLAPVEDRTIEDDDTVTIDYILSIEGKDDLEETNYSFVLKDTLLPDEVKEALKGAKLNDVIEVTIDEVKDDEGNVKEAKRTYKITVTEVKAKVLPEINDEMAKDAGYEDLEDMRQKLKEKLSAEQEKIAKNRFETKLLDAIIEKHEIPLPPHYLESTLSHKAEDFVRQLSAMMQGQPLQLDPATFKETLRAETEQELRVAILLRHIIKEFDIETSEEELDAELQKIADEQGRSVAYIKSMYRPQDLDSLKNDIAQRKAIELITSKVSIKEETLTPTALKERIDEEAKARAQKAKEEEAKKVQETLDAQAAEEETKAAEEETKVAEEKTESEKSESSEE